MSTVDMQSMFEGLFALVVSCYLIGLGIGYVVLIIRSAASRK